MVFFKKTKENFSEPSLLYIISWWDYLMPCGMSARIDGLVNQLKKMNINPLVLTPTFADYVGFSKREAKFIKRINLRWLSSSKILPTPLVKLFGMVLFSLYCFAAISVRFLFDRRRNEMIVQYQDVFSAPPALLAKKLFGVKVVGDDVRLYFKHKKFPFSYIQGIYEMLILKNTDVVTTSFSLDYRLLKDIRKNEGLLFIPNGVKSASILNKDRDSSRVLFVGQFAATENVAALKDIFLIADGLSKLSNVKIFVVGGPLDMVNKLVKKHKSPLNNVEFLGRVPQEKLDYLYSTSAVGILPYFGKSKHTSQRIKALEYLSNGLLVVASSAAVDGFNNLKNGHHYILSENREEMITNLNAVLSDYSRFSKIASEGRTFIIQNYSWDEVAKPYLNLINCLRQSNVSSIPSKQ